MLLFLFLLSSESDGQLCNYLKVEEIEFRRVPTIVFDSASEMRQTKKLLEELSPI